MVNENYSNFTATSSNKDFYNPNQPENHRKENEKGASRIDSTKTSNEVV